MCALLGLLITGMGILPLEVTISAVTTVYAVAVVAVHSPAQWSHRCQPCDGDDDADDSFREIAETRRQLQSQDARNAAATARFNRHGGGIRWMSDGRIMHNPLGQVSRQLGSTPPSDDGNGGLIANGDLMCACPTGECQVLADFPYSYYCDFCYFDHDDPIPQCTCDCTGCIPAVDGS